MELVAVPNVEHPWLHANEKTQTTVSLVKLIPADNIPRLQRCNNKPISLNKQIFVLFFLALRHFSQFLTQLITIFCRTC